MTHQNLAVCFGPVLLTPPKEAWRQGEGARGLWPSEELASTVDFKRHIEALHYLLQLWPGETGPGPFLRVLSSEVLCDILVFLSADTQNRSGAAHMARGGGGGVTARARWSGPAGESTAHQPVRRRLE